MALKRMDNVGIVVDDLGAAIDFFRELGLALEAFVARMSAATCGTGRSRPRRRRSRRDCCHAGSRGAVDRAENNDRARTWSFPRRTSSVSLPHAPCAGQEIPL